MSALSDASQAELRREALHLAEGFRERNRTALLNLLSDSTIALTGFVLLLRNSEGRGALFGTIGRVFSGFSDTAKAFLIIASERPVTFPLAADMLREAPVSGRAAVHSGACCNKSARWYARLHVVDGELANCCAEPERCDVLCSHRHSARVPL